MTLLSSTLTLENPVSLPSGRLENTTRSSPHHMAQHRPTGSETTPPYAPQSSRFGSEPPSVEDDVDDVWRYAILELHARNDDDDVDVQMTYGWITSLCEISAVFTCQTALTLHINCSLFTFTCQ